MKKLILAVLLAAALALPAGASQQTSVLVNGVQLQQEAIMHNGSVYVPLREAAESLGFGVVWDGQRVLVDIPDAAPAEPEPAGLTRPEILGDVQFTKAINDAMDLLYEKDAAHYALVVQNVELIGINDRDEVNENKAETTAVSRGNAIMFMPGFLDHELFTPKFVAAVLTHEAVHSANRNVRGNYFWQRYDIKTEEIIALEHEIATLKLVDAPGWIIKDCERLINEYKN